MIQKLLTILVEGKHLTFAQAKEAFLEILEEKATDAQMAAFLTALTIKGETANEIAACALVAREKARRINVDTNLLGRSVPLEVLDTCGTGGSGVEKFNVSTAVSFVVSALGVTVAKHGNRSVSSRTGSADVLEAMGIKIDADPAIMEKAIHTIGIGFLYAPLYHKAFKAVSGIRKEMGIRTVFNLVGPLCNPAFANYQLLGVHNASLVATLASVVKKLGVTRAFIVHSPDLGDEVSLSSKTKVAYLDKKKIKHTFFTPRTFGLKKVPVKSLRAKTPKESARTILDIFKGKKSGARDVVLANASCCFYLLGKVKDLRQGAALAAQLIDDGKVERKYFAFKQYLEGYA